MQVTVKLSESFIVRSYDFKKLTVLRNILVFFKLLKNFLASLVLHMANT